MRPFAKNVRHGAENVRHGAKNVRHGAKNVRHGAKITEFPNPQIPLSPDPPTPWSPNPPIPQFPNPHWTAQHPVGKDNILDDTSSLSNSCMVLKKKKLRTSLDATF